MLSWSVLVQCLSNALWKPRHKFQENATVLDEFGLGEITKEIARSMTPTSDTPWFQIIFGPLILMAAWFCGPWMVGHAIKMCQEPRYCHWEMHSWCVVRSEMNAAHPECVLWFNFKCVTQLQSDSTSNELTLNCHEFVFCVLYDCLWMAALFRTTAMSGVVAFNAYLQSTFAQPRIINSRNTYSVV